MRVLPTRLINSIKHEHSCKILYLSADSTFLVIRKCFFFLTEPTCYRTNFPYAISGKQTGAFSFIVLRVMRLMYTRGLNRFSNCAGATFCGILSGYLLCLEVYGIYGSAVAQW